MLMAAASHLGLSLMMRSLIALLWAGAAADLASRARARISDVFDERRARLLNGAIGETVSARQLLALTRLLGDNFIPTSSKEEMGSAKGMCRVNETRPYDFRFDHGLHCNIVDEWFFAVGSHLPTEMGSRVPEMGSPGVVVSFVVALAFQKMFPSACACDYGVDAPRPTAPRLGDAGGRAVDALFAVARGPPGAANFSRAAPASFFWTGDDAVDAAWGFRVPNLSFEGDADLETIRVLAADGDAGIAVNLTLERHGRPFLLQGGDGYVGSPATGNGMGYYSLPELDTSGSVTFDGETSTLRGGLSWMDHQWGTFGIPQHDVLQDALIADLYRQGKMNFNPVNVGFSVPGTENWFGLQVDGVGAFTAYLASSRLWSERGPDVNVTLAFPDGQVLTRDGQRAVNYSYTATRYLEHAGSSFAVDFTFSNRGDATFGLPETFHVASSLRNGDDLMEWSSGGRFLESPALVKNDAGEVIGRGFTEAVGWDRTQLADTVGVALGDARPSDATVGLLTSRPPRVEPVPPTTDVPRHIPDRECYFPLPTDCAPGA